MENKLVTLSGMYKDYFLDYASYVILERAVPDILDGFKPVQRRILHSMKQMDDGRYHKVANIIGQTMQYHPHGDAAIGDALVKMGQRDLLIDCQGNWGDIRTGDGSAAPRYIEARLTKFAIDVIFNPQTTDWQISYDGRKNEPITLPVKFPMVLTQGVDGIAVGLSTKIMPHNFIELIQASIKVLLGKKVKLYPDFQTGGFVDVSDYKDGKRGGKIKVRAKIEMVDKNTLKVTELPYSVTTCSLIDSILKANDKGQIKIKKVVDNTAKEVEVLLDLATGVSPQLTMDALYAFTHCEISISPNACVIIDNKPHFLTVSEILDISTSRTKDLLRQELEIKKGELEEKWHLASLEKIFIEKRIYRDIEECESWEEVIKTIDLGLQKYIATPTDNQGENETRLMMMRDITEEDIVKLTEIRIKRISKYNSFKANEKIIHLEEELEQVKFDLANLTDFTIKYFENLLAKYSKGKERKTSITSFEDIEVQQVVANNAKLYVDRKEGFIGMGMRKDEFVCDCSDIDDIIVFTKDGKCMVTRIADKSFVGKNIIHVAVWKKGDERTTYNMIYVDAKTGRSMAKRFHIKAITRDKHYDLTTKNNNNKVHYFTANPNGETEVVEIQLTQSCTAKKKKFEFDFGDLAIKGRGSKGNIVTKYPVRKVTQISIGKSSLGAMKVWMDEVSGRLNEEERGIYLGAFDTGAQILTIYKDGSYEVTELDMARKFETAKILYISKFAPQKPVSAVYFEGEKSWSMVKRFIIETTTLDQKFVFITEHTSSKLYFASQGDEAVVKYSYKKGGKKEEETLNLPEFIDVKGWKALGNKLGEFRILKITEEKPHSDSKEITPDSDDDTTRQPNKSHEDAPDQESKNKDVQDKSNKGKYRPGDSIDLFS